MRIVLRVLRNILLFYVLVIMLLQGSSVRAQSVNGEIISDSAGLTVVKVWGTFHERGFAYGYLCAQKIINVYNGYFVPLYGPYLGFARQVVTDGTTFGIDPEYFDEAMGVIEGMDSAGIDVAGLDHIDLIAANCLLDVMGVGGMKGMDTTMGCSSLMSWGQATSASPLNGKAVISRHLDWSNNTVLISNQVLVAHVPSEPGLQPWLLCGFAGQISVLSGVNASGVGVFQHMMSDFTGTGAAGEHYEPVWFSLRKALETDDYNGDGSNNTKDVSAVLSSHSTGYADGYIITMIAPANTDTACLTARVAEIAPASPWIVFRDAAYTDSLPGDNLYAANYEIARNNHHHFCTRYNNVVAALGNGLGLGAAENWNIMRDTSVSLSPANNLQFMQFIPEDGIFRLSVYKHSKPAYKNLPDEYYLDQLFSLPAGLAGKNDNRLIRVFPNPSSGDAVIDLSLPRMMRAEITLCDLSGRIIRHYPKADFLSGHTRVSLPRNLSAGTYYIILGTDEGNQSVVFIRTK